MYHTQRALVKLESKALFKEKIVKQLIGLELLSNFVKKLR